MKDNNDFDLSTDDILSNGDSFTVLDETPEEKIKQEKKPKSENRAKSYKTLREENEAKNKNEKTKSKEKPERKRYKKSGGCLGCFTGIIATIICAFCLIVFGGCFLLDRFLIVNYGLSLSDCFSLVSAVWYVDEGKVITEGKATDKDREEFYSDIADSMFIKDDTIDSLINMAVDEYVVPIVADALGNSEKNSSALPLFASNQGNDWKELLQKLTDDGFVDKEKIEDYFKDTRPADIKYENDYVLKLKGKGMVSTIDYVIKRALKSNPETQKLAGTFGISQIKFESSGGKKVNVVLDVKLQKAVIAFMESPMFEKFVTESTVRENKGLIRQFLGLLPSQILIPLDINIGETITVDVGLNNLSKGQVDKWFEFAKKVMGLDVKGALNEAVNNAYKNLRDSLIKYVDIEQLILDGYLKVDLYDIVSVILNEQMGLSGDKSLNKVETFTTVSNVLYANMEVNGNGIATILEQNAPAFVNADWKQKAESDFIDWFATNVAFDKKHTLDDVMQKFKDETGKLVVPSQFTSFLEFIDTEYLRKGVAFLKKGMTFDDRFIAYLFEDYKQEIFESAGYGKLASALTLQYVSISTSIVDGIERHLLSLGLSSTTSELCNALGYGEFDFISAFIGSEEFLCVTADITLDKAIERIPTTLMLNGLSAQQTSDIFATVKKITGYDVMGDLIDKNLDKFVDVLVDYSNSKYSLGFEVKVNPDGTNTGMLILPSMKDILQQILVDTGNKTLNAEELIDAVGVLLSSTPSTDNYLASLADTSVALTGKDDSYESYDEVVTKALLGKYFLEEEDDLEEILEIIFMALKEDSEALDELIGTEEKAGRIKITSAYFNNNPTLKSTQPIIDGHTLAHVLNKSKAFFTDFIGEESAMFIEIVDIRDIAILDGYLSLTVASTPAKLLNLEQMQSLDLYVKKFIYNIFGGENADVTVTLKINVADNADKVKIYVQNMGEENMQAIFDLLKSFGVKVFDFNDANNMFVKLADQIAGFVNQYATIEGNKATLPSVFGLINQVLGNDQLTEEAMYNAVRSLMVSNANTSDYNDVLCEANEALTGNNESGYTYDELVATYAEKKYLMKDGKNIGDLLGVVAGGGDDVVGALTNEENGVINFTRFAFAEYFNNVAPTYELSFPIIDSHSLAFIFDSYKEALASVMGLDATSTDLLNMVQIADITVNDGILTIRIVLNVSELTESLAQGDGASIGKFFNILEEGKEIVSVSLSIGLDNDVTTLVVNNMSDKEVEDINLLLRVFGITYFDMTDVNNPLVGILKEAKSVINEYMPYSNDDKIFKMKSIFDFVAENVDFEGNKISSVDGYTLVRSFTTYDDSLAEEEVNTQYKNELNALVKEHYAIDNGFDTMKKLVSGGGFSMDELDFDANIFRNSSRSYVNSFIYEDIYLSAFINDLDLFKQDGGFKLNRVEVLQKDKIKVNLLVELESAVSGDFGIMTKILPSQLSITIPMSFKDNDHGVWNIDGMRDQDDVIRILKEVMSVELKNVIVEQRDSFISVAKNDISAHGMSFDVEGEKAGLLMPSICTLYSKEKKDVSEQDAIYLFDNLVCYKEVEHSIFTEEYTEKDAKSEFMDIMSKYYHVKDKYSGKAQYVYDNGDKVTENVTDLEITFDILLASFGFYVHDYEGYVIETKELMDIDDVSMLYDREAMLRLTNDVLFKNEIVTLWIDRIGFSNQFDLEKIQVIGNDQISITGFIGMSDHLGENVCQTAKSLMCENLNVTMKIDLSNGSLIDYYVEDLAGDVDGNFEDIDDNYSKTKKLVEIVQKLDDSLDINDEMFVEHAKDIVTSVNNMLDMIVGIDPYKAQSGDTTEQKAKTVYYDEGCVPNELIVFGANCGFLLPDGASYAYKNCQDFRNMFDTYYPYME